MIACQYSGFHAVGAPGGQPLPFLAATLLVADVTALICAIATRTSLRADIC